jgi:hypothetical protein
MSFVWPNSQCLGRQPCAAPCLVGCHNLRWKDGPNERAIDRRLLRKSFGNYNINDSNSPITCTGGDLCAQLIDSSGVCGHSGPGLLTPFRRAMNAGDPYLKVNTAPSTTIYPPPSNQVNAPARTSLAGWGVIAGHAARVPNGSAYTGNPKFVYDGSDYIRFKKLQAKNRNYNDPTYGGDSHRASQQAYSRVRH